MSSGRPERPPAPASLLSLLVGLCLLRVGPQDLPYSPRLSYLLVALAALLGAGYAAAVGIDGSAPRLLLSLLFLLLLPWLLLGWRQRRPRYPQTLAALAGSDALFTTLFLPVALLAQSAGPVAPQAELAPAQVALGWLVLALFGWKLLVNGHILRHALDLPQAIGVMLALGWFAIEFGLDQHFFGTPA